MKYPRLTFLSACLVLASTGLVHAQNLIANPSFEDGATDWSIFIPPASSNDNCQFTISTDSPHSGTNCAELQSDQFSRYAIEPHIDFHPNPGERYHISVWVKADPTTEVEPGAPGIVIRVTLQQNGKDTVAGHFFLELNNVMTRATDAPPITSDTPTTPANPANAGAPAVTPTPTPGMIKLPTVWTKMEGDFTMPADADSAGFDFFAWHTKGPIYFDDVSLEKLP